MIFVYSTSKNSLVFGHQQAVAEEIAAYFDEVVVVTSEDLNNNSSNSKYKVIDLQWNSNSKYQNILNMLKVFFQEIRPRRDAVIFSYMTEVQSAILAPITRLLHIPHYLWYAHQSKSIYIRWCHAWLDRIITSTNESIPFSDNKIAIIGQNIDHSKFQYLPKSRFTLQRALYVGRVDPSKQLELLILFLRKALKNGNRISLTLVGQATLGYEWYLENLKSLNEDLIKEGALFFLGKIPNDELPSTLIKYDFFVNAFPGSLDKSLVEATLVGLPVITINNSYRQSFGQWVNASSGQDSLTILYDEFEYIKVLVPSELETACKRRATYAIQHHSRTQWVPRLIEILDSK